jgi:hypothetical protein
LHCILARFAGDYFLASFSATAADDSGMPPTAGDSDGNLHVSNLSSDDERYEVYSCGGARGSKGRLTSYGLVADCLASFFGSWAAVLKLMSSELLATIGLELERGS